MTDAALASALAGVRSAAHATRMERARTQKKAREAIGHLMAGDEEGRWNKGMEILCELAGTKPTRLPKGKALKGRAAIEELKRIARGPSRPFGAGRRG